MNEDIVVNIDFDGSFAACQNSIQVVPADIAWEDFELMLKVFADRENIRIHYIDDENDLIIISCEEELREAFKVAKRTNNTLCLKIKSGNPPTEQLDRETKQIHTDLPSQSVSMKIARVPLTSEVVPIAMETGEQVSPKEVVSDPSCDKLVAKETGEKLAVPKDKEQKAAPPKPAAKKEGKDKTFFFIKHKTTGLVLDVARWSQQPSSPVILWKQKDRRVERIGNQLWYKDNQTTTIRSKFCNMCLTAGSADQQLTVMPYDQDSPSQTWVIKDESICHPCIPDIALVPANLREGSGISLVEVCHPGQAQQWAVEYRDVVKPGRKTNRETGETQSGAIPKAQKKSVEHYGRLAAAFRRHPSLTDCIPPMKTDTTKAPPKWFFDYMENFKKELVDQSSNRIAQKTVNRVLRGLEGAVITSVQEVNQHVTKADHVTAADSAKGKAYVATSQTGMYCHNGIICDHCEKTIIGVRYKCGNCEDYDLCERCEGLKNVHDSEHIFLKIRNPLFTAGRKRDGRLAPLLAKNLYRQEAEMVQKLHAHNLDIQFPRPDAPAAHPRHTNKDPVEKLKRKQEKLRKKGEKIKVKEEKLKRRIEEEKELPQKKEKLELPQYQVPDRMDAEFLRDDTIPDGTHVQPGTKFVKRWVMKNTGVSPWTQGTILQMIFGNMTPVEPEVEVPYVAPGEEGMIEVSLIAPDEPGVFQSHWRLSYCGVRFGHRIWCSIVVDPKEVLDPRETSIDLDLKMVKSTSEEPPKEETEPEETEERAENQETTEEHDESTPLLSNDDSANQKPEEATNEEPEVLSKEDLLSFEMLEITERETAKQSQTATPNNTPLESRNVTPPATPRSRLSPVRDLEDNTSQLSRCSSVEVVSEVGQDAPEGNEVTAELVQQRMATLGLGSYKEDADIETISTCSEDSSSDDSDSDFFIVPIPDFFNPNLPASRSASTSLYVNKDTFTDGNQGATVEGDVEESQPLLGPSANFDYHPVETANQDEEIFELANEHGQDINDQSDDNNEEMTGEEASAVDQVTPKEPITGEVKEVNAPAQNEGLEAAAQVQTVERESVDVMDPMDEDCRPRHPKEVATTIMTQAFDIATKGATTVYHTAKDVFHTLQAKNAYEPPRSNWQPPAQDWTPPNINWTPPRQDWTPPDDETAVEPEQLVPPEADTPAQNAPEENTDPMEILMEMGFADRALNRTLLEKHENNVERVIQELLQLADNDWHANRH